MTKRQRDRLQRNFDKLVDAYVNIPAVQGANMARLFNLIPAYVCDRMAFDKKDWDYLCDIETSSYRRSGGYGTVPPPKRSDARIHLREMRAFLRDFAKSRGLTFHITTSAKRK